MHHVESTHYQLHHTRGTTVIAGARDTAGTRHQGCLCTSVLRDYAGFASTHKLYEFQFIAVIQEIWHQALCIH